MMIRRYFTWTSFSHILMQDVVEHTEKAPGISPGCPIVMYSIFFSTPIIWINLSYTRMIDCMIKIL